jgi:hypothetical protein
MVACSAAIDGEEAFPEFWVLKVVHRRISGPPSGGRRLHDWLRGRAKAKAGLRL